jgi:hypothetical protein
VDSPVLIPLPLAVVLFFIKAIWNKGEEYFRYLKPYFFFITWANKEASFN